MEVDIKVGCTYSVDVTHVNDPHSLYVRLADVHDFLKTIEKPGNHATFDGLHVGMRVIFKSKLLKKYIRGTLHFIDLSRPKAAFHVFAIDYGHQEDTVKLKHIYYPDKNAEPGILCPPLAIHCRLYLCEPPGDTFSKETIDFMKECIGEDTATVTIRSKFNNQLVVELTTNDCPRDVSTMLALVDLTLLSANNTMIHRASNFVTKQSLILNYKHRDLNVGDMLHVRVQGGDSLSAFYVAEVNEYKKFYRKKSEFTMYCRKIKQMRDEDILPGRSCAVKADDVLEYERAIIKDIMKPNTTASVQLVDWGKIITCNFVWIKSVDSEVYYVNPILAIYCSTDEAQAWATSLPKFLYPGYELVIKIIKLGNGFSEPHKVNIYPVEPCA